MTNWYDSIVTALKDSIEAVFEKKSNKVTSWSSTTSDTNYPSEKLVKSSLDGKVSKSSTTGLLKNDGTVDTNTYLTSSSISGKEDSSNKVSSWSSTTTDAHYPSEKLVKTGLDGKVDKETGKGLFSGSYTDLTNKPTIPSAYVHPSEKQCSYAYSHPSEKQCNYSYSHPSAKQCNATIPSASSSTPSADVSGGAIGSSSNYAKADHQHPLSSAYATASHTQNLSTINNVTTVAVVVTYTDSTSETLNLVKYTGN